MMAPTVLAKPRSSAVTDPEWGDDGRLDLLAPVRSAWRHRRAVGIAVVAAAVLGLVTALVLPKRYSGSAIMFVTTMAPNPLDQEPISVESLRHLATSPAIEARTVAELRKRNQLPDGQRVLDFDAQLYRSIVPSQPYLPMLALTVDATTADLARDAANTWAAVFAEDAAKFVAATRRNTGDAFAADYQKAAAKVHEAELEINRLRDEQARELSKVKTEAAESLREMQLWSRDRLVAQLEEEAQRLPVDLRAAEASIAAIEQELQRLSGGTSNPAHAQLSGQLAAARVKRNELSARLGALPNQIAGARRDAASIRASLAAGDRAVEDLERKQKVELDAKERELAVVVRGFRKLQERIGDAGFLKETNDVTVSLGTPAEAAAAPSGPSKIRYLAAGALIGLLLAVCGAWIADRAYAPL